MYRLGFYHCHHDAGHSLPESPASAEEMLRYREFLADAAREIVQEAFRAVRIADPERYDAQVRAKLSPKPFVGPGLVRSVWRTVESRGGSITAVSTAINAIPVGWSRRARRRRAPAAGSGASIHPAAAPTARAPRSTNPMKRQVALLRQVPGPPAPPSKAGSIRSLGSLSDQTIAPASPT